ncbi:MAG: ribosome-associated translation inhibitor RaiA [Saprospiraceae bacterium]|nr:ribosome-associated translation inhibitor RaiA [Saprospiraceae bacterium]
MRVYTESVAFKADQKLLEYVERKLAKMDQFFDRIIDAHVVLKLENAGQVRDKVVEVRINVPGDILIAKESRKTFEASVASAVEALRRQLIRYKELAD